VYFGSGYLSEKVESPCERLTPFQKMQNRAVIAVLALLAAQCVPVVSLSVSQEARLFLRSHVGKGPNDDQLAELRNENPSAYALVKALLTKRSLGLLNSRHPTASFAAPKQDDDEEKPSGEAVFGKFARPGELNLARVQTTASEVALPYGDVAPAAHHDWLNWKPQASGMSDDQMVQNVLGAVASLSGKKAGLLSKHRSSSESSLSADEASFGVEPEPAHKAEPVAPPAPHENSYLKNVDFGLRTPEAPAQPAAPHKNSYLEGLDLTGDMPKSVAIETSKKTSQIESSSSNALASFSWDDAKPKEDAPKPLLPKANGKDNSLMSWLGVVDKAPAPKAAAAPAKPSNPYMMDLS